jgi:nicotinamidase-related amidase
MRIPDPDCIALLVIDVQRAFDDAAYWGPRNNPRCEENIAALRAAATLSVSTIC